MQEIWKDIVGYEGLYQVSNLGRIKSLPNGNHKKEKIKVPVEQSNGYLQVGLHKDRKKERKLIHRLVAENFMPNLANNMVVNHKNGEKSDNRLENLEWCTQKVNIKHAKDNGYFGQYGRRLCKLVKYIKKKLKYETNPNKREIYEEILRQIKD